MKGQGRQGRAEQGWGNPGILKWKWTLQDIHKMSAKTTRYFICTLYFTLQQCLKFQDLFSDNIRGLQPACLAWPLTSERSQGMWFTCLLEPMLFSSQPGENYPEPLSNLQLEFLTSILHSNNCNKVRKSLFMAPGLPPPPQNKAMGINASIQSFQKQVLFSYGIWWQIFRTWSICSLSSLPREWKNKYYREGEVHTWMHKPQMLPQSVCISNPEWIYKTLLLILL